MVCWTSGSRSDNRLSALVDVDVLHDHRLAGLRPVPVQRLDLGGVGAHQLRGAIDVLVRL
jgi:hypothetical protein